MNKNVHVRQDTSSQRLLSRRTMFYRRLRKKGTQEDQLKKAKKRVITTTAISRGIAGLSVEDLKAKKNESSDKRKAVRDATLRCVCTLACSLLEVLSE